MRLGTWTMTRTWNKIGSGLENSKIRKKLISHPNLEVMSPLIFVSYSRLENSETKLRNETKLSGLKQNWEIGVLWPISFIQGLKNKNFKKLTCFSWKMVLHNRKKINLTSFFRVQTFRLYYIWLFWTLKIEKTRCLNFVSFPGLGNSETKLSGDSMLLIRGRNNWEVG